MTGLVGGVLVNGVVPFGLSGILLSSILHRSGVLWNADLIRMLPI